VVVQLCLRKARNRSVRPRRSQTLESRDAGSTGERETALLRQEGEYWTLGFAGQVVRLRDTRGVRYLAALLRAPGKRLSAVDLRLAAGGGVPLVERATEDDATDEGARLAVTKGIKNALSRIASVHPELGDHLTVAVRRGYFCSYVPDPRHPITWET
jgi:hypothetical protein